MRRKINAVVAGVLFGAAMYAFALSIGDRMSFMRVWAITASFIVIELLIWGWCPRRSPSSQIGLGLTT
jgi:hypothetical protein